MPYLKPQDRIAVYDVKLKAIERRIAEIRVKRSETKKIIERERNAIKEKHRVSADHAILRMVNKHTDRMNDMRSWEKRHLQQWREYSDKIVETNLEVEKEKLKQGSVSSEGLPNISTTTSKQQQAEQMKVDSAPSLSKANSKAIDARSATGSQRKHRWELDKIFGERSKNPRRTKRPPRKGR